MSLLDLNDDRWSTYNGGYSHTPYDPRPLIRRLVVGESDQELWATVWDELHHQGDIGEASYALVSYLPKFLSVADSIDWNPLGFTAVVEIERHSAGNPSVPRELQTSYHAALLDLPARALSHRSPPRDIGFTQCLAACVAAGLGHRHLARAYLDFGEDEALTFLRETIGFEPESAA